MFKRGDCDYFCRYLVANIRTRGLMKKIRGSTVVQITLMGDVCICTRIYMYFTNTPIAVEILDLITDHKYEPCGGSKEKVEGSSLSVKLNLLKTMNVWPEFWANPFKKNVLLLVALQGKELVSFRGLCVREPSLWLLAGSTVTADATLQEWNTSAKSQSQLPTSKY